MLAPTFVWNPLKYAENQRKHGVSFEEASDAFRDEHGLLLYDPDHSGAEDRYLLLGLSARLRLLVVCHCYRESETVIRIISARKATTNEALQYERGGS